MKTLTALTLLALSTTALAGGNKHQPPKQPDPPAQHQDIDIGMQASAKASADATGVGIAKSENVNHNANLNSSIAHGGDASAVQGQHQGQHQNQHQSQSSSSNMYNSGNSAQSQTAHNEGVVTEINATVQRSAPSVSTWATVPTADCRKPYAIGGSVVSGSGLFSWTRPDRDCQHNNAISRAIAMRQFRLAIELFCTSREIRESIGTARCKQLYVAPAPDPEPQPNIVIVPQSVTRDEVNQTIDRAMKTLLAK